MNRRRRGRPSISTRGSEVFSIRVPQGTAAILKAGFKTISVLAEEPVDSASVILQAQLQAIEGLSAGNSALATSAIRGIRHTLGVIEMAKNHGISVDDAVAL
jgi:hypothetical protein